jgi:hypothetical protein
VTTHFEDIIRQNSQRLADLKKTTEDLQRELSEARVSLERQLSRTPHGHDVMQEQLPDLYLGAAEELLAEPDADTVPRHYPAAGQIYYSPDEPPFTGEGLRYAGEDQESSADTPDPTVGIVNHGRQSAYRRGVSRRTAIAIMGAVAVLATVLAVIISSGGSSWPASVATVQAEITKACQNPDVASEPGQVNFACSKATRQILWVFALLTSDNNPRFEDTRTGRQGLEPITPAQGGEVAASLNLHHPYDPADPIDSIAVAARAINDIIGGATLTGTDGNPVVQSGLEGSSRNCLRYTGSGLVTSRQGFPDLCTNPIASSGGQAALVADVYRKWIVGASAGAAHDAAVLFTNAGNPGDRQVQAILRQLGHQTLAA